MQFAAAGCSPAPSAPLSSSTVQQTLTGNNGTSEGARVAVFITDTQRETTYGKAVLSTVGRFTGEEGVSSGAYTVRPEDTDALFATMELAIKGSAEVVVLIGEELAGFAQSAGSSYPDIHFILLNYAGEPIIRDNTVQVAYESSQAGWLAGYAAVTYGARSLGYFTGEDEQEELYALGFVLGAEAAAKELLLEKNSVVITPISLPQELSFSEQRAFLASAYIAELDLLYINSAEWQQDAVRLAENQMKAYIVMDTQLSDGDSPAASVNRAAGAALYGLLEKWNKGRPAQGSLQYGLADKGYAIDTREFNDYGETQYLSALAQFGRAGYDPKELVREDGVAPVSTLELETVWIAYPVEGGAAGERILPPLLEEE